MATIIWDLTPACPGELIEGRVETIDLSPLSLLPSASLGGEGFKGLGVFLLQVKPFFHLVSSQDIQSVQENPFSLMSSSENLKVSLSAQAFSTQSQRHLKVDSTF